MKDKLIFDWNHTKRPSGDEITVKLVDETLRDGLQSPSVTHPSLDQKLELLHYMAQLGIDGVDIGFPGVSEQQAEETYYLAREIARHRLPLRPYCAARTLVADIEPIANISNRVGIPIGVAAFIGSSPVRLLAENWDVDFLLRQTRQGVSFAVQHGLPCMYVTEDTTRTDPDVLRTLCLTALDLGASRICLCDTVGHVLPEGVYSLVKFVQAFIDEAGMQVALDWHGHDDKGMAVANSLAAIEAGVERVHGCGLGIGERCGNTPLDILLVNLKLMMLIKNDLSCLPNYVHLISEACHVPIPYNYPALGKDAFRTSSGIHAAAIIKAIQKGDRKLANTVYSGVPANLVGREQCIEIGPMSGESNVRYWLQQNHISATDEMITHILGLAKQTNCVLADDDIRAAVQCVDLGVVG